MPTVNDETNIQQKHLKVGRKLVENFKIIFAWGHLQYIKYWEDVGVQIARMDYGQLVPKTILTQDNSYPGQLVPKTTRPQDVTRTGVSYLWSCEVHTDLTYTLSTVVITLPLSIAEKNRPTIQEVLNAI